MREFRLDAAEGSFAANFDRFKVAPYGLLGGEPGTPGRLTVRRAGSRDAENLPSKVAGLALKIGDVIRLETAGGGGFGDKLHRDETLTCRDREQGYIDMVLEVLSEA